MVQCSVELKSRRRLWTQKSVLLAFYRGIVKDMPWGPKVINAYWLTLAVTIAPCLITTFVGCSPFDHYWKVLVVPDRCTEAVRQLIVVGKSRSYSLGREKQSLNKNSI